MRNNISLFYYFWWNNTTGFVVFSSLNEMNNLTEIYAFPCSMGNFTVF